MRRGALAAELRSQQFKFANTSWRGLRFGFDANTPEAYRGWLFPVLLLWFSGTLGIAWVRNDPQVCELGGSAARDGRDSMDASPSQGLPARTRPLREKLAFSFHPVLLQFYWTYAKGLVFLAAGTFAGGLVAFRLLGWATQAAVGAGRNPLVSPLSILWCSWSGIIVFLFSWPYLAARIQQAVWSTTTSSRRDPLRHADRRRRALPPTLQNVFLTLATLGLYWPFASMRLAKNRIECMRVASETPLGTIAAGTHARSVGATGEGALDAFGLDLGL